MKKKKYTAVQVGRYWRVAIRGRIANLGGRRRTAEEHCLWYITYILNNEDNVRSYFVR